MMFSFILSACGEDQVDFQTFAASIALNGNAEAKGFKQAIEIKYEETVVYLETRKLEPDEDAFKLTTQVLKRLNDLEGKSQYSENEAEEVERVEEINNGLGIEFKEEYFLSPYTIKINLNESVFVGEIKAEATKLFMNDDSFTGENLEVSVTINNETRYLKTIIISYRTENGNTSRIETNIIY